MGMHETRNVTTLLIALRKGDEHALDALFTLLYDELRRIAHRQLVRRRGTNYWTRPRLRSMPTPLRSSSWTRLWTVCKSSNPGSVR
jgi:hypothetical protein